MTGNSNRIGVAMVGCGFAATFHSSAYRKVHGLEINLTGVYGRQPQVAKQFASEQGFQKIYSSFEHILEDPEVDLVDACVPNRFHEEFVIAALSAGKHVVIEKPFTGAFVPGRDPDGWQRTLDDAMSSAQRMISAENNAQGRILYAENLIYAPGVQKARALLESADTPVLRIVGEESHSGTHSSYAMNWKTSGGGSLVNKGCHPLGVALYLKYQEGLRRKNVRIRPSWVVASVANLTDSEAFHSESTHSIRTGWTDCEDWATMTVGFDDGTVAQISAADTVVGGIQNLLTVYAGKTTLHININPNDAVLAYATDESVFKDEYIREKVETKAGWQFTNPDEDWMNGFPSEIQDFCESVAEDREPISDSFLGCDVVAVIYSAYLSAATGRRVQIPLL